MADKPTVEQALRYCENGKICDPYILLEVLAAEVKRLRATLQDISETPCSMVNDSESIRFSFNQVSALARRAIAPTP